MKIKYLINRIKNYFELRKYNDFTIAEYYRKLGAQVGEDCRIQVKGLSSEPYLVKIHNHVTIASNVALITHDGGCWVFRDEYPDLNVFGKIEIMDNCFIGMGSMIMPNVVIGPNSIVGAGAVVTKDVPPNTIVAGIPARVISTIDQYKKKCLETWAKQQPDDFFIEKKKKYTGEEIYQLLSTEKYQNILKKHLMNYFWRK